MKQAIANFLLRLADYFGVNRPSWGLVDYWEKRAERVESELQTARADVAHEVAGSLRLKKQLERDNCELIDLRNEHLELSDKLSELTLETELARLDSRATAMAVENPRTAWLEGNAKAFRQFLDSEHGRAFSGRLRTVAAECAINGANDQKNTTHSAGVSAGWNECVRYIHSLSRVSGDQETKTNDEIPRGETELLERLSP